jgi:hypothetical protein
MNVGVIKAPRSPGCKDKPLMTHTPAVPRAGAGENRRIEPAPAQQKGGTTLPCDYKLYPENWLSDIRPLILRRAGAIPEKGIEAKCEWCGVQNHTVASRSTEAQPNPTWVVLTIAHLDQDIEHNDPDNLAALCQKCHLLWDRPWHLINAGLTRDRHKNQPLLPTIDPEEWRQHVKEKQLTHSFNVLLGDEEMSMLSLMSNASSTNKSIVIRQAIKWRYMHELKTIPTCANGRACFVPHMHAQPAATPQGAKP